MGKSSKKKTRAQAGASEIAAQAPGRAATEPVSAGLRAALTQFQWRVGVAAIMAVGLLLRLYDIYLKPLHHDEGVNGFFLTTLYRSGVYRYDPTNYHGPTLYYFSLAVSAINGVLFGKEAGLSTFSVRFTTVLFGLGTVWLIFLLRKQLGDVGTLAAAALVAVSPGMVFISRYYIHEMLFAFFTVGMVVAAAQFYDHTPPDKGKREFGYWCAASAVLLAVFAYYTATRPASFKLLLACTLLNLAACVVTLYQYEGPRSLSFLFGVSCLALLFGTKETAFISVGVLLIAVVAAQIYLKLIHPKLFAGSASAVAGENLWAKLNLDAVRLAVLIVVGLGVFLFLSILFYSSFFTHPDGLKGAIDAYAVWRKTGQRDHIHPLYRYLEWLFYEEGALLLLGGGGAALALFRPRARRFAVFAGLWAVGIIAAYSLIPYKTPWLAISFLPPLALAAGYAVSHFYGDGRDAGLRNIAGALLAGALALGLYQSWKLNFVEYDNDQYVYVYAHSRRALNDLTGKVDAAIARSPQGKETGITITSPEYWPLPWYFRNYSHAGFVGSMTDTKEPIVIGRIEQLNELQTKLGDGYKYFGTFDLRPGVTLVLFIKYDIAP